MTLVSNLPYPYLTKEQNDYFAGITPEVCAMTPAQRLATAVTAVPRHQFERAEAFMDQLEHFWNLVSSWGSKNRLIYLESEYYPSLGKQSVEGLRDINMVMFPEEWKGDLSSALKYQITPFLKSYSTELVVAQWLDILPPGLELLMQRKGNIYHILGVRYHRLLLRVSVNPTYVLGGETDEN